MKKMYWRWILMLLVLVLAAMPVLAEEGETVPAAPALEQSGEGEAAKPQQTPDGSSGEQNTSAPVQTQEAPASSETAAPGAAAPVQADPSPASDAGTVPAQTPGTEGGQSVPGTEGTQNVPGAEGTQGTSGSEGTQVLPGTEGTEPTVPAQGTGDETAPSADPAVTSEPSAEPQAPEGTDAQETAQPGTETPAPEGTGAPQESPAAVTPAPESPAPTDVPETAEPTPAPTEVPAEPLSLKARISANLVRVGEALDVNIEISGGKLPYTVYISNIENDAREFESTETIAGANVTYSIAPKNAGRCSIHVAVLDGAGIRVEKYIDYRASKKGRESQEKWEEVFKDIELTGDFGLDMAAIAKTQIGYEESFEDVVIEKDTIMGYTRYGDFLGAPYAEWCAAFTAFVAHYAEVPFASQIRTSSVKAVVQAMRDLGAYHNAKGYTPGIGDLVFIKVEDDPLAHMGIVEAVVGDQVATIQGNVRDSVVEKTYTLGDKSLTSYGSMVDIMHRYGVEPKVREEVEQALPENPTEALPGDEKIAAPEEEVEEPLGEPEEEEGEEPEVPVEGTYDPPLKAWTGSKNVNLRFKPDSTTRRVAVLEKLGSPVRVNGYRVVEGEIWYKVANKDYHGWVRGDLIVMNEESIQEDQKVILPDREILTEGDIVEGDGAVIPQTEEDDEHFGEVPEEETPEADNSEAADVEELSEAADVDDELSEAADVEEESEAADVELSEAADEDEDSSEAADVEEELSEAADVEEGLSEAAEVTEDDEVFGTEDEALSEAAEIEEEAEEEAAELSEEESGSLTTSQVEGTNVRLSWEMPDEHTLFAVLETRDGLRNLVGLSETGDTVVEDLTPGSHQLRIVYCTIEDNVLHYGEVLDVVEVEIEG